MLYGFSRKTLIFKTWVMPDTLKVSAILGKFRRVAFKHALNGRCFKYLPFFILTNVKIKICVNFIQ